MAGKKPPIVIERATHLPRDADTVWSGMVDLKLVNAELMPLVRMTLPPDVTLTGLASNDIGRPLFSVWLLAFGFLPFDRHTLGLDGLLVRGFSERSHSWMNREWRHRREVVPEGTGCVVTDRVEVTPRLRVFDGLVRVLVNAIFDHRQRRLKVLFA